MNFSFPFLFVFFVLFLCACQMSPEPKKDPNPAPPTAKRIVKVDEINGDRREDAYFWLREKENPAVADYLNAENSYADSVMKPTEEFQTTLYKEMLGRIKETDLSVPYRNGEYFYYSRTEQGKQYPIYCRKKGSLEGTEQVTLDLNELGKDLKFISLGDYTVSDDGNLLAYSLDTTGFRQYTLYIKDLRTGEVLPDRAEKTGSLTWASDNQTLFYTVEDSAKRHYRLYRHRLRETNDAMVFEEKDERFRVDAFRTRSQAYILLGANSHTTSEWRYLKADNPTGEWKLIAERKQDQEYQLDHHGELFYILTNDKGRNFRLVSAPVSDPRDSNWTEILGHNPRIMLEDVDCFANHLVVSERENGLPQIRITNLTTNQSHRIHFPEPVYSTSENQNEEFDTNLFRYGYQSFVTPNSVFDYNMDKKESALLKQTEVLGGYDATRYESARVFAKASDGTSIPISLVYKKGTTKDGKNPVHLVGYGSYGYPYPIFFSSNRLSLIDRGVVCAVAHIRGGGDMGKRWHDEGRMMKKKNSFTDFIAASEFLVEEKWTAKDRLIIQGGSAGGLLMGAVSNLRPDLFKAVVSQVPFVDVINTMLDESLPLTVGEFEEWGNPKKKDEYEYMKSYCPYTNLEHKAYPAMLVKTSFNDSQVMYWEPAKYVAKMRTLKTDHNPLILKTNMAAGHGGASGRYDYLKEIAFDYAFILGQLGITK